MPTGAGGLNDQIARLIGEALQGHKLNWPPWMQIARARMPDVLAQVSRAMSIEPGFAKQ